MIRLGNYALVAMMVVFLIAAHMALVTFSPVLSSKVLADAIGPRIERGTWWRSMANMKPGRHWGSICDARSVF